MDNPTALRFLKFWVKNWQKGWIERAVTGYPDTGLFFGTHCKHKIYISDLMLVNNKKLRW